MVEVEYDSMAIEIDATHLLTQSPLYSLAIYTNKIGCDIYILVNF